MGELFDLTKKMLVQYNTYSTEMDFDKAIKHIEDVTLKTIETFSDQVTCVDLVTYKPVFNVVKARILRDIISKSFDSILETIDEEMSEHVENNNESASVINITGGGEFDTLPTDKHKEVSVAVPDVLKISVEDQIENLKTRLEALEKANAMLGGI